MKPNQRYTVCLRWQNRISEGPQFGTLEEALAFCEQCKDEGSHAIRYPNGQWHRWDTTASD